MQQWQLAEGDDFSRLQLVETDVPRPKYREVIVRMRAASLNYRDILTAKNPRQPRIVPLSDGAGEVVEIGEGVERWKVGDRVCPTFFRDWESGRFTARHHAGALGGAIDGVLSEFFVSPSHGLVEIPVHFSFEEAATLPCAGLTAWTALIERGRFTPGDSVLLQGTGGVSIWGLQIALASGGKVLITSSSDEKLQRARETGASQTVNYRRTPDWEKEVWTLTGKQGVDHVLDVAGTQTLAKSLQSVANGGHVAQIGVLTGFDAPPEPLFALATKNATLSGIYVGPREDFEKFVRFLNITHIRPVIDRTFRFGDAVAAYEYMESGAHFGKIVISF